MKHVHGESIEQVTILLKYVGFRSFSNDRRGRQDKHILQFFDGHLQPNTLPRAKPPDNKRLIVFVVRSRLILERNEEVERSSFGVDGIREVPDLQCLVKRRPVDLIILRKAAADRPIVFCGLREERGLSLKRMTFYEQSLMICQSGQ